MGGMFPKNTVERAKMPEGHFSGWVYVRVTVCYLLCVALLWKLGIESIYGHPTPFYALPLPSFSSPVVPGVAVLTIWLMCIVFRVRSFAVPIEQNNLTIIVGLILGVFIGSTFMSEVVPGDQAIASVLKTHWGEFKWHALAIGLFGGSFWALFKVLRGIDWQNREQSPRAAAWFLVALVAFVFIFSASVAMLRGGPDGISQAYERTGYEYIDDIGTGLSIRGLFHDYVKVRPFLSMHAKVHPPGPIAILWALSYIFGRGAMALSLATMAVGALSVIPLYHWAADLFGRRTALLSCLLYSVVPTIVLFTATSADIIFMPFTLTTLFLFGRSIRASRASACVVYAILAGMFYCALSLISFSLLSLGAFFGFMGIWRIIQSKKVGGVVLTAIVMLASFLLFHFLVRWWSGGIEGGFDVIACFRDCKEQFDTDQANLDALTPRFPAWSWKLLNPACWFFFAGVPLSVLFLKRVFSSGHGSRGLVAVFALTLIALDLAYLARGEGERSAMYIIPFLLLPGAHMLDDLVRTNRSLLPLASALGFMGFQCWLIESFLYTYW